MKTNVGKSFVLCLCVLVASSSCFQNHIQALTAKVNKLFGNEPNSDSSMASAWEPENDDGPLATPRCNICTGDRFSLCSDWMNMSSGLTDNWWMLAVSLVLSFIVMWRIQYNMGHRLDDWKKSFIQKEKAHSRRLTLPDLTLAKHARRESLAESSQKHANHPQKMSQCNISRFKSMGKSSFERNEEQLGDSKRVHIIRRRH